MHNKYTATLTLKMNFQGNLSILFYYWMYINSHWTLVAIIIDFSSDKEKNHYLTQDFGSLDDLSNTRLVIDL